MIAMRRSLPHYFVGNYVLPVIWQIAKKCNVEDIKRWLSKNEFPKTQTSDSIITELAEGNIGTDVIGVVTT